MLLSAGVGATPVLAMLHALAARSTAREVWWLHGARNRAEHAFGDEVDALLAELPGSHRIVAYSQPDQTGTPRPTTTSPGGSTSTVDRTPPASRSTPTTTCAGPTVSCTRSAPR